MDPVTASLIIGGLGAGLSGAGSAINGGAANRTSLQIAQLQDRGQTQRANAQIGLAESMADPFRQQMAQAKNLARLGMMGAPRNTQAAAPGQPYQRSTYTPSPELMQWLAAIQQNIAGGQNRAPSISGFSGSSAMNLLDPAVMANPGAAMGVPAPYQPRPGAGGPSDRGGNA